LTKLQAGALWLRDKLRSNACDTRRVKEKLSKEDYDTLLDYDLSNDENVSEKIDIDTCTLRDKPSVRIVLENLFEGTLNSVDMYYVCLGCGHVYWVRLSCE
jgi:hypothetical protein